MEQVLSTIEAGALLVAEETGEPVAKFVSEGEDAEKLQAAASRFTTLDKLSANLKMGPIQQLVTVSDDSATLCVRNPQDKVVSVASATTLDRTFLAQNCLSKLLN